MTLEVKRINTAIGVDIGVAGRQAEDPIGHLLEVEGVDYVVAIDVTARASRRKGVAAGQ